MSRGYGKIFRNVLLPGYETVLRRRKTLSYLEAYERQQWLPPDALAALTWQRLQRLIEHCWANVPYYRRIWTELGLSSAQDIRTFSDYQRLPVLTKQDIRENFADLHALQYSRTPQSTALLYKTTGGSTGEPLRFGYTRESYERRTAVMWRGYGWAGAWPGRRTAYLWGGTLAGTSRSAAWKDRVYNALYNRRMLDSFAMNEANLAGYARAIADAKPEIVVAYVGPIVQLARWMLDTGTTIDGVSSIITGAEALHDFQRPVIEAAFPLAKVFNSYGCREFMLIASECEYHDGLHINVDHLHLEMLPAEQGHPRQLVLTDLSNDGMPFIRYVNGDVALPGSDAPCACGRTLPKLAQVTGRKLDIIRSADGRLVPGEFFPHMFKDVPGVVRFQVVQSRLDHLLVKIVPDADYSHIQEAYIRDQIGRVVGIATQVELRRVDEIALTPSGKHRVTVSELA